MPVKAQAKNLKISARKLGLVAALVRGRSVSDALTILEHTPKRSAQLLGEVIKSARANAEHNQKLDPKELYLSQVLVGPGFRLKRIRPAAYGRAHPYRRPRAHVTVVLEKMPRTEPKSQSAKDQRQTATVGGTKK